MNKWGLMTVASFAISFMMVIAAMAANTGSSYGSSGSAGSTGTPGITNPSDEGLSSDQSGEYGMAPEFRGEDFSTPYGGEMSSGGNRNYSPYKVTPDKVKNSPY